MPKIPLYNQGLGGTVDLATGQLSPRASGAAAGQVASSFAQLGKAVQSASNVVADFERVRQEAEADEIAGRFEIESIDEPAMILNANESIRDVSSYRDESSKLRNTVLSQVDGLNVSNFQKRVIKGKANNRLNLQFASGESRAFDRFLADASQTFNQKATNLINQSVADPTLEAINVQQYAVDYKAAIAKGITPTYTPESIQKKINSERLYSMSVDETLRDASALNMFENEVGLILNNEGRYANYSGEEKREALAIIDPKVSYLETERVLELESDYNDSITSLSMPSRPGQPTRQDTLNGIYAITDEMASLGQTAQAEKLRLEADTIMGNMKALDFLAFADDSKVQELLDKNYGAMVSLRGTDLAYESAFQYQNLQELALARSEAINADPALYITDAYKRKHGRNPTISQIIQLSQSMGIEDSQIKPLTGAQVDSVTSSINNAETPEDVRNIFAGLTTNPDSTPYVMRQVMGSGVSVAMNYVANNPNDPVSRQLFNAFRPDALQIKPSQTARDLVRSMVISNDNVQTHNKSMLGGAYANYDDDNIVPSASDSRSYADHRAKHNDMITQLAIYMIQEDGKMLVGEEKITPSQIEQYVEQATSVYTNRYSYLTAFPNKNVALRIPKSLERNRSTIQKGLSDIVTGLEPVDIHYSSLNYPEGSPEFGVERQRYLDEIQDGYGWVMSNDGVTAMLIDPQGGLVYQEVENDLGQVDVVPITSDLQFAFKTGTDVERGEDIEARSVSDLVP